jgi:hypothetical protein
VNVCLIGVGCTSKHTLSKKVYDKLLLSDINPRGALRYAGTVCLIMNTNVTPHEGSFIYLFLSKGITYKTKKISRKTPT